MRTLRIHSALVNTENGEVLREDISESASSWPSVEALQRDRKAAADRNHYVELFEARPLGFLRIEVKDDMPDTWVVQEVSLR